MAGSQATNTGPRLIVEPLAPHHDRAAFSCGIQELDTYLLRFARQNDKRDVSRPFVVVPSGSSSEIMGYYTLSNYAIVCSALPPELAKGLPSRISLPGTLLGRLAIDERYQSQGLGKKLLWYALRAALRAAHTSASLGVAVDAMTDDLVPFYQKRGFIELLDKPRHLLMPINRIRTLFPEEAEGLPDIRAIIQVTVAASEILEELSMSPLSGHTLTLIGELQSRLDTLLGPRGNPE